ncbi:MAG: serine hydrolase domain-containing protein [Bacteroidales bacterium]
MKLKNILIITGIIVLVYFIFVAGKDTTVINKPDENAFIAGANVYYHMDEILGQNKAGQLDALFTRLNKKGIFNGTVLYGERGKIIYKAAFGYDDFRSKDSLKMDDAFQLASVSKMFTAMAIMILKEDGKLEFDDKINRFIPEWPYPDVTIRQCLTHRSGMSRYMSLADAHWNVNTPINNEEVIDLFVKYIPSPYFKPDDGFHYCNTNYMLLASVVERITGQHFDEFVKEQIFDPLDMDDSFVYNLRGDTCINKEIPVGVPGYQSYGRRPAKVGDYYLNGVMGDKGVYSSVEDLFKFNLSFDEGTLVSMATLQEGFEPGSPLYYKRKDNYGFGWRLRADMDSTAYHFGWWKGFRTYLCGI